ncbi:MAG: type IV secretory system conjugative DNA transfer family protein, partial [Oscillibacter sp.]|nr:type IV secretory system conjugative DNA transfer family protein [Oscillibacter sp.]
MFRLSKLLEKLEDRLANKYGSWYDRNKKKFPVYVPVGVVGLYFYGMFINSLKLGTASTFHVSGQPEVTSIWVLNPFKNLFVLFTPYGISTTAVLVLLTWLITKKGYIWFSGYKYTHDERGFDIIPDGTHGTSGFLTEREMREFLELSPMTDVKGMALGKFKRHPGDTDKYAIYVAHHMRPGDNNNLLCIGAPGSGKSRGFIIPFLIGCAQRGESVFVTDPKGELFEKLSPYFAEHGHYVKAVNFLDMEHSDGWNCLYGLDTETQLVQTVANTIIANTSGPKEADDFWSRAELNLLMALIHYVCRLTDNQGNLLPIEQRGIGNIYQILAHEKIEDINRILSELPPEHPAKGPHGLFLKAKENLWGNIVIGLGNRLAVYQSQLVDKITRNHDVDLILPGKRPCAYFVIISAQDSSYRFLSSLFFSLAIPQLSDYARLHGDCGRLPVLVNFCLDEYCNIGYMDGMADALNSIRGFNMSCQIVVQSLSQWEEKYPGKEWENQLGTFNSTLYMGCNDISSADYIAKKCGKVTISVTNNQMPLMPLFSPVYTSTRPYSQTRSNTARDLMLSDEVLRLDNRKCLVLFQGHKPAMLYKLTPEEIPGYKDLKSCRVIDYIPAWKRREMGESVGTAGAVGQTPIEQTSEQPSNHGAVSSSNSTTTRAVPQSFNRQTVAGTTGTQPRQSQQIRTQPRQGQQPRPKASQRTGGAWTYPQPATRPAHTSRQEYAPMPVQNAAGQNTQRRPQESARQPPPELVYDFSSLSAGPGIPD